MRHKAYYVLHSTLYAFALRPTLLSEARMDVRIEIVRDRCKGCGLCVVHCPRKLLHISDVPNAHGDYPVEIRDSEECSGCFNCAEICPDQVFIIERTG